MDEHEERARKAMSEAQSGPLLAVTPERTVAIFAAAIRDAVAEEREACARACEKIDNGSGFTHGPTASAQLVSPAPGDEVVPFSAAEHRTMALPPQPAEVAALLRSVEWGGGNVCGNRLCPACGGVEPSEGEPFVARGHIPDCALALMLARCEP